MALHPSEKKRPDRIYGDPYTNGYAAQQRCDERNANPYTKNVESAELWNAGWDEAVADTQEEQKREQ